MSRQIHVATWMIGEAIADFVETKKKKNKNNNNDDNNKETTTIPNSQFSLHF